MYDIRSISGGDHRDSIEPYIRFALKIEKQIVRKFTTRLVQGATISLSTSESTTQEIIEII
jgi:hypothetical protein